MVIITHDLGVARGRADEIMVMYGGRIMEKAPAERVFQEMKHPYTEALLSSILQASLFPRQLPADFQSPQRGISRHERQGCGTCYRKRRFGRG